MDNQPSYEKEDKGILFEKPTFIDPLTGLFNRFYLYQFLPQETNKAELGNYPLSILMVDLDGFKQINDNYGHRCGDEILKQIAEILKKRLRRTDAVIRYAGDEFVLLLPTVSIEKARDIANQIIDDVNNVEFIGTEKQKLHLTLSIGFSVYPSDAKEIDKLIDMADKALYLSKQKGRNRACHAKEVTLEAISSLAAMDSFPCQSFIDRTEELNRLKQIFDIVSTSNILQVVFVSGGTGVGKTRTLGEIKDYLHDKVRLISCTASAEHSQDPYYLFSKGIGAYLEDVHIDSLEVTTLLSKIPFEELVALSLVIPELASAVKAPKYWGIQDAQARFLLFKAFLDFLIELNKSSIIVMAFDDIQFADKASIEFLRYLIKQEKNKRIYVIATIIAEDKSRQATRDGDMQETLREIGFSDTFTEIKLNNLLLDDTLQMLNAIFAHLSEDKKFIELLFSITRGNPCFIEELLKSLVESGLLVYQDNLWKTSKEITLEDIPLSLEEVIKRRVKGLDEETKEMILQAAVIGEDFKLDLLRKIGNKDEGFIFELVNRAKKMRLIDELKTGDFHFTNKNVQGVLYNGMDEAKRRDLHYKVAQTLVSEHKDNLYNVAGALSFHFGKSPESEDAVKYNRVFLDMTQELFNPYEIMEYLKMLAKDIISEEEKAVVEIPEEIMKDAIRLIRSLKGAIKAFRLYPTNSTIRTSCVKELKDIVNDIIFNKKVERIDISEVEKSLVINAKRVPPKQLQDGGIEDFVYLMMDRSIKTISFIKGLQENEVDSFIQYINADYHDIINKGGWKEVLIKEGVEHIKIDEIKFTTVGRASSPEFGDKDKLQNVMLMEFLLGKLDHSAMDKGGLITTMKNDPKKFAKMIIETAEKTTAEGKIKDKTQAVGSIIDKMQSQVLAEEPQGNYAKDIAKVVIELEPMLRNKFIRSKLLTGDPKQKEMMDAVIDSVPDEVIVDIILEEYRESEGDLLTMKDFVKEIVKDEERRKRLLPKLESKLSEIKADKEDIAFITGQLNWEDLLVDKRINNLIRVSKDGTYTVESVEIKNVLEELNSLRKIGELENTIQQLLLTANKFDYTGRKKIIGAINDFIKTDFVSEKREPANRIDALLERVRVETDPKNFLELLEIFGEVVDDCMNKLSESKDIISELENPVIKKYLFFINRLFYLFQERLKLKEDYHRPIHECIRNFVLGMNQLKVSQALILSLVNCATHDMYNIRELSLIIRDPLIDTLIHLGTDLIAQLNDPFKKYVIQKRVLGILIELQDISFERLKTILQDESKKEELDVSLIDLAGYLKNEGFIDSLLLFIEHKNPFVRSVAIRALGEIGTDKSLEIISQVARTDKDKKIRLQAKEQLKVHK